MPVGLKQYGTVVDDMLATSGKAAETRILYLLRLLRIEGGNMRTDSKALGDGLFELTPTAKKKEYRLIYAFHGGDAVILNCFEKKSRKTPKHELDLAKERFRLLLVSPNRFENVSIH